MVHLKYLNTLKNRQDYPTCISYNTQQPNSTDPPSGELGCHQNNNLPPKATPTGCPWCNGSMLSTSHCLLEFSPENICNTETGIPTNMWKKTAFQENITYAIRRVKMFFHEGCVCAKLCMYNSIGEQS